MEQQPCSSCSCSPPTAATATCTSCSCSRPLEPCAADGGCTGGVPSLYNATLAARRRSYGPNTSLSYSQPLMFVRGSGCHLYDADDNAYLDCVNNVTHLGHGNAEVAAAVSTQLHTLNTNSRYLHPALPAYTEALLATLNGPPGSSCATAECGGGGCSSSSSSSSGGGADSGGGSDSSVGRSAAANGEPLEVLYLTCSGSEANDLALRIATANFRNGAGAGSATSGQTPPLDASPPTAEPLHVAVEPLHVAVMGGAYHGHTKALIDLSPYKFWGLGGGGKAPHVHVVPCPDPYRRENLDGAAAGRAVLAAAAAAGGRLAAFFAESVLSCGGQVVLPPGYLRDLYGVLRCEGVVLVADEVQCGFGRCGAAFWGFQTQGVRPDIVTMGKPIGNGYPLAALAVTRRLAEGFAAPGMEYFNTYGGSTAAVAAGAAVLRVLQRDRLQEHAARVGSALLVSLRRLQAEFPEVIGDVRGLGLFLGIETVTDAASRQHAPATAKWIKERLKARRILLSTDGPYDNVIKVKPPMVFGMREADTLVRELRDVLTVELTPEVRQRLAVEEAHHWAAVYGPRQELYRANERRLYGGGGAAGGSVAAAPPPRRARL